MSSEITQWWGTYEVELDSGGQWCIGPARLLVYRLAHEWRMVLEPGHDPGASGVAIELPAELPAQLDHLMAHAQVRCFGVSDDSTQLVLEPQLPDQPVVATPERKVEIPAQGELTVYVSSTLWLRVSVGRTPRKLLELPLQPMAETWFGRSTHEGELCYASRTPCRLHLDDLAVLPHRAITSVRVQNQSRLPLVISELKLPVPYLALYAASNGSLWTQDVVVEHEERELMPVQIRQSAPQHAEGATLVASARRQTLENLMMRAFGSLFSE